MSETVSISTEAMELAAQQKALESKNKAALDKCEKVIQRGEVAFMSAAKAVVQIVEGELFKPWYSDKTNYFEKRWSMAKQDLLRYEQAGRILRDLEEEGYDGERLPQNVGQCRELYKHCSDKGDYDENKLQTLWGTVVDGGEKITAKVIAETADNLFLPQDRETEPAVAAETKADYIVSLTVGQADERLDKVFRSEAKDNVYNIRVSSKDAAKLLGRVAAWFGKHAETLNLKSFTVTVA